jgi:hypothetical protein
MSSTRVQPEHAPANQATGAAIVKPKAGSGKPRSKQGKASKEGAMIEQSPSLSSLTNHIQNAEDVITEYHPLKSFGCVLSVTLLHHAKGAAAPVRKLVQYRDNLRFKGRRQFEEWVQLCLFGVTEKDSTLRFEYYDEVPPTYRPHLLVER